MAPKGAYSLAGLLILSLAAAAWPKRSYQTEDFNIPYFNVTRKGPPTDNGYLFLGVVHAHSPDLRGPFIANDTGDLIWHGSSDERAYYNFQTQKIDGKPTLTYWTGFLDYSGHGYGAVTVLDDSYRQIKRICFPDSVFIQVPRPRTSFPNGTHTKNPCYVDKHESLVTDRNSILVTAYNATQTDLTALNGPVDGWVYDCLIFELDLDTNEVLFQWSALDHVPVTKSNFRGHNKTNPLHVDGRQMGFERANPFDWFHINSIDYVPGGYIANSRMTWSMYLIDGQTGNVNWTLEGSNGGDFELLDPIFFSWQHDARLQGMSRDQSTMYIHLFNNDNIPGIVREVNASSGYYLNVNTKDMTVSTIQFLQDKHIPPIYAAAEGSVQTLPNGHHLVGYGERPFIQEYDRKARVIYNAEFGTPLDTTHSYRAYRKHWTGNPRNRPKVVASVVGEHVQAYMSWNGATECTAWNVYAGEAADNLTLVDGSVSKNGFETMDSFRLGDAQYRYVMVEALDSAGERLAKSSVEPISGARHRT